MCRHDFNRLGCSSRAVRSLAMLAVIGTPVRAARLFISSRAMAHLSYSLNPLSLQVGSGGFPATFNHTLPLVPPCPCPLMLPPEVVVHSTFTRGFPAPAKEPSLFLKCCRNPSPSGAVEQLHSFGPTRTASYRYEPAYPSPCAVAVPLSFYWPQTALHRASSYG